MSNNPYISPLSDSRSYPVIGEQIPRSPIATPKILPRSQQEIVKTVAVFNPLHYGSFVNQQISIGVLSELILIRPPTRRTFLFIQNTHAIQNLFIAFGTPSTLLLGARIGPNGSWTFDSAIPQDDIHIIADGAATTGVIVYCNADKS